MRSALGALLVVVASCSGQSDASVGDTVGGDDRASATADGEGSEHAAAREVPPRAEDGLLQPVVLVTIDGARWQEIFEGTDATRTPGAVRAPREIVPNLDRIAHERGVAIGAPGKGVFAATGPNFVSLPGYTEIFTGRAPRGCQDNDCPGADTPTVLDQASAFGAKVAAFTSWEKLERATSSHHDAATRPFPVSSGRGGAPDVSPWPGHGDYRPDKLTAEAALAYLEKERPDVLYVGLGDPDEHAHHGDYDAYVESLTDADAVVGKILEALARMGPRGQRTHVLVTADHGRAADFRNHGGQAPESARSWLVATGPTIVARGRVVSTRPHHLSDVAPTLRTILGLPRDTFAFAGTPIDELFVAGGE